jgi:phosphate-selective porin OprO/OprP
VSASYVLTGEENTWRGFTPKRPFAPGAGQWGAWEVTARVGQLDIDDEAFPLFANPDTSATLATSWGVGLNWHLNRNFKINLNYEQTQFDGGTAALLQDGEHAFLARAQISF